MISLKAAPNTLRVKESNTIVDDMPSVLIAEKETNQSLMSFDLLNGGGASQTGNHNEIFYVVDGEVEVKSEMFQYVAKKGSYVIITGGENSLSLENHTNKKVSLLWL